MNGSELYQYILDNTLHELKGTWEVTQDNELKVTGTDVNGSYVVFPDALTNFSLEWDMTILSSGGSTNSGISPIILSSYQGSNLEGWNNGSTITNAKFAYFLCNHRNTANFGSIFIHNNGTAQGGWQNSTYQNTFNVGTKYRYKLERKNGLFNLYQDNILVSSFIDITNNIPIYLGWYMWWGGTYTNLQANFIIDNYVVTGLSTDTTKYLNGTGLSEVWTNTKNYISAQLLGKSDVGHTHSASDITSGLATVATSGSYNDLSNKPTIPTVNNATLTIQKNGTTVKTFTANASSDVTCNITVPTKTSDLTNDSNFITEDTTKIPLSGTSALSGSIVPSTDNTYNLGNSNNKFKSIKTNLLSTFQVAPSTDSESLLLNHDLSYGGFLGSGLVLRGKNSSIETGCFNLLASNGTNSATLQGTPSGTLTWGGKNIDCVEEQTNASNGYIRYTNGIQICWGGFMNNNNIEAAKSSYTFPKAFNAEPRIIVTTNLLDLYLVTATANATTFTVAFIQCYATPVTFTENNVVFDYIAIGTWK